MATQIMQCVGKDEFDFTADPLNSIFSGSTLPASNTRIPRDFTITTDSYISLCSRVYAACCSVYPDFGRDIPESAFQYYAVILLWKRLANILPYSAKRYSTFFEEVAKVGNFYAPAPLRTYLQGIGYFRDPDGCDRRFVLPVTPTSEKISGILYTFGKVNAKTHFFYEALPAPGIAAMRIQAHIKYTEAACEKNLWWNLPEGLHPDIQESNIESVIPTKNLLGWAPADRLTASQLEFFKTLKIDENFMPSTFSPSNTIVHSMFTKINTHFANWGSHARNAKSGAMGTLYGLSLNGSVVQGMAIEKHYEPFEFDRSTMYCEGNVSVNSPYETNDTLNKGAVVAGYRMAKEAVGDRHCWSCYDFDEYKHVPQSWIRSRNSTYTFGKVGRLNETVNATAQISKKVLQNECIQHTLFKTPASICL